MPNKLNHISFIMDGNNRWSKKNKINKYDSYSTGAEKLLNLSSFLFKNYEIKYISAFSLSKNNLNRSSATIKLIKNILYDKLKNIKKNNLNFNIKFIGDRTFLDKKTKDLIKEYDHNNNHFHNLVIFLNYSGKQDILNASKLYKKLNNSYEKNLLTLNIPDPDILIRTGGFKRISDFMLYQIAFTELFFLNKLWPDINNTDLKKIISKYRIIERKFGI